MEGESELGLNGWEIGGGLRNPSVAIQAAFTDPYQDDPAATASLGNSWIDSGINALSAS